eukprot:6214398-Pleurochrysis_carterae.AAC.1
MRCKPTQEKQQQTCKTRQVQAKVIMCDVTTVLSHKQPNLPSVQDRPERRTISSQFRHKFRRRSNIDAS